MVLSSQKEVTGRWREEILEAILSTAENKHDQGIFSCPICFFLFGLRYPLGQTFVPEDMKHALVMYPGVLEDGNSESDARLHWRYNLVRSLHNSPSHTARKSLTSLIAKCARTLLNRAFFLLLSVPFNAPGNLWSFLFFPSFLSQLS